MDLLRRTVWKILTTQYPHEADLETLFAYASVSGSAHDPLSTTRTSRVIILPNRNTSLRKMIYNGHSFFHVGSTTGLAVNVFSLGGVCTLQTNELIKLSIRCAGASIFAKSASLTESSPGLADPRAVWNGPFVLN